MNVPPTLRRDVLAAYAAAGARVGSWAAVSAAVYRWISPEAFAVLALVRGVLGLLNYAALGLGPAMVRELSKVARDNDAPNRPPSATLDYAPADEFSNLPRDRATRSVYASGSFLALLCGTAAFVLLYVYAQWFSTIHRLPAGVPGPMADALVLFFGFGVAARLHSDAGGAVLQTRGRIAADNALLAGTEVLWAATTVALMYAVKEWVPTLTSAAPLPTGWAAHLAWFALVVGPTAMLPVVGVTYALTGGLLLVLRLALAGRELGGGASLAFRDKSLIDWPTVRRLLAFGGLVTVAQAADFLYAPTDYLLIAALLDPADIAAYAPAVQVDAALLLAVAGLSAVLLPRAALAHAAGDAAAVRRYYVRGTLASLALLTLAAVAFWAVAPWAFRLWLGDDLPATRAILPGVLVHTVVGGGGAVGRAVLIGTGRVRAFTASVLVAGVANVILSASFVAAGLGLRGIVLGTVLVVVARCAVWMPWYTLRAIARTDRP